MASQPASAPAPPNELDALWSRMRADASGNRRLSLVLADLRPISFAAGVLRVHAPAAVKPAVQSLLPELRTLLRAAAQNENADVELVVPEVSLASTQQASATITEHPLVKEAIELLGARVVGVYPRTKPPA